MTSEKETTTCMGCGSQVKSADLNSDLPDNGWKLYPDDFGYYSGFHDSFGEEESRPFIICHDCVVKLLELFPRLAEMIHPGGHPCQDETPCCRHAWQATEIFGKREFGVHTRTAWPDGVWHDDPPREGP
jgi:hypothetical protein